MAEEDNASKLINAAAREIVRVVKHPATDEYLILLDTSVVPDNAVLVNVTKWGTPLEKGAKTADKVPEDKIFVCKPIKPRNPERRPGREPAQARYNLIKRHNGRFYPAEAAAPKTASEPKAKRAKKDAPAAAAATSVATQEKKKKSAAREEPSRKLLEDALKAIKEYTKHAK